MVSVHQLAAAKRKPRKARRPNSPVQVTRVDPCVLALAFDIANGDMARVRIIDASTVLVVNRPRRTRPV